QSYRQLFFRRLSAGTQGRFLPKIREKLVQISSASASSRGPATGYRRPSSSISRHSRRRLDDLVLRGHAVLDRLLNGPGVDGLRRERNSCLNFTRDVVSWRRRLRFELRQPACNRGFGVKRRESPGDLFGASDVASAAPLLVDRIQVCSRIDDQLQRR